MLKLLIFIIVLSVFVDARRAVACGSTVGEIKPGEKVVGVEIKDARRGDAKYAMDDDGMLTLFLVASHCYGSKNKIDSEPLACARDMRGVVKKAAARNAEFMIEQSKPDYLTTLGLSPAAKSAYVANLKADQVHAQKLVEMFSSVPVKTGDFREWVDGLKDVIDHHGYQMVRSPDDKFDPDKQTDLSDILMGLNSPLPFVLRTRCGIEFPRDLAEKLKPVIWEPRASGPGTQGGKKKTKR